jgi:serine/threonine protein kinase
VLATALEVARGLQYLHAPERRMVHRDLSASNVLLTTAGGDERGFRALLSDFGAAAAGLGRCLWGGCASAEAAGSILPMGSGAVCSGCRVACGAVPSTACGLLLAIFHRTDDILGQ